jgi:predicted DNA-binding transcriptional regulator AlpA
MSLLWVYQNLKDNHIVENRMGLKRLVELHGFPPGRLLSAQKRVWLQEEVLEWIASRPVEHTLPLRGACKAKRDGRLQREREAAAAAGNDTKPSAQP